MKLHFSRKNVLAGINLILCFGFAIMAANILRTSNGDTTIYSYVALVSMSMFTNGVLAYFILYKKSLVELSYSLTLTLTASVLWYIFAIIAAFLASNSIVLLILILIIYVLFLFLRRKSLKVAILVSICSLVIVLASFTMGFEESYCVRKGIAVDPTGEKMIPITFEEDVKNLSAYLGDTKIGDQIGLNFREHMKCHTTFQFMDAFMDELKFSSP